MTSADRNYAQIQKEVLATTFACERFHQYIFGRTVLVDTHHKPLIPLFVKPLNDSLMHTQRLMLELQKYDLKVLYVPGKQLIAPGPWSRAVDITADQNVTEDDASAYVDMVTSSIPVSEKRQEQ
ncbi:hypothetical protein HOLleu_25946 [Holothuria leucospilota]|uniref:Reverse transcriptase RNase H-like domain-containing protein n=1 Tax=Holothuria leucospilota TaxID=206669 RepID=A0A9Q1H261_HOLLE|nr:hypothetical protein HOLleu_25946 [Holothuria leucospilota]